MEHALTYVELMGIRHWLRHRLAGDTAGDDTPPGRALLHALWGGGEERVRALGEYRAGTYPKELAEQLARRQEVTEQLLEIDVSDRQARIGAIPRLQELLRVYPHPIVYELLLQAYLDSGRFDEARGVAFAARERRLACARSEYPEIRSEIEHLSEWTLDDIEQLRVERGLETGRT